MRFDVNGISLCVALQTMITLVSVIAGLIVIVQGNAEVGIGIMLAAFSSAGTVTNNLEQCDRRKEDG